MIDGGEVPKAPGQTVTLDHRFRHAIRMNNEETFTLRPSDISRPPPSRRGDFHFSQLGVQFSELGARLSNALGPRARQQQIVATFSRRDVFFESARAGHCLLALGW